MRRLSLLLAMTLVGASVAGCGAPRVGPGASASPQVPTYRCGLPGGTQTPCTPEQYAIQEQQAVLAANAADVYVKMVTEYAALQRKGGVTEPSPELAALSGGPYLAAQKDYLAKLASLSAKLSGEVKVSKTRPAAGASERGYVTAIMACVDASKTQVVAGSSVVAKGQLIAETVYFKRDGDALKAWDAEKADPATC